MSPSWIWSDKITNERVARVGYNHFISNKGKWNNCFSKFSNRVLPPIFISTIFQCVRKENLAHYFPYDVKLGLLAHSRSFLANQKARNAIVGVENLLKSHIAARRGANLLGSVRGLAEFTKQILQSDWFCERAEFSHPPGDNRANFFRERSSGNSQSFAFLLFHPPLINELTNQTSCRQFLWIPCHLVPNRGETNSVSLLTTET